MFRDKHNLPESEMAIFQFVSDNIELFGIDMGSVRAPAQETM
jgi:hypothetical protein